MDMTVGKIMELQRSNDADGEKLSVVSQDGVLNRLTLYRAAHSRAVILCMPAMGVRASYYRPFAVKLALAGWHVVTADLRGNGESGVRVRNGARFGYRELLELDWPANVAGVRERFPGLPVFLLGHSLGGQLNTLYAARSPHQVAGLIQIASGSVHFRGWPLVQGMKILAQSQLLRAITEVVGYLPGEKVGFAGNEAKQMIRDWAGVAITGKYRPAGSQFDYEAGMHKLSLPVLSLAFTDDGYAPPGAADVLLGKTPNADVARQALTPGELGLESVGHYSWVKNCGDIVPRVSFWLEQHC